MEVSLATQPKLSSTASEEVAPESKVAEVASERQVASESQVASVSEKTRTQPERGWELYISERLEVPAVSLPGTRLRLEPPPLGKGKCMVLLRETIHF